SWRRRWTWRPLRATSAATARAIAAGGAVCRRPARVRMRRSRSGLELGPSRRTAGRSGNKIPAAGRAGAEGRALGAGAPVAAGQRAGFVGDRAAPAAGRAGGFGGQGLGLVFQEGSEGARGQAAGGRRGDPFQGEAIDVRAGAGLPESTPGSNCPPAGRQFTDCLEVLGCQLRSGHRLSCLSVTPKHREGHSFPFYGKASSPAKPVQGSPFPAGPRRLARFGATRLEYLSLTNSSASCRRRGVSRARSASKGPFGPG